jgi:uncharacterized protein YaeQ
MVLPAFKMWKKSRFLYVIQTLTSPSIAPVTSHWSSAMPAKMKAQNDRNTHPLVRIPRYAHNRVSISRNICNSKDRCEIRRKKNKSNKHLWMPVSTDMQNRRAAALRCRRPHSQSVYRYRTISTVLVVPATMNKLRHNKNICQNILPTTLATITGDRRTGSVALCHNLSNSIGEHKNVKAHGTHTSTVCWKHGETAMRVTLLLLNKFSSWKTETESCATIKTLFSLSIIWKRLTNTMSPDHSPKSA